MTNRTVMGLTPDERTWIDEKFKSLHTRLDQQQKELSRARDVETTINNLQIEVAKRPTISQVMTALGVFLTIGIAFGSLIGHLFL